MLLNSVRINNHELHYLKVGNGEEKLLCFPGFGQSASYFYECLPDTIRERYEVFVLEPFFVGQSQWNSSDKLSNETLYTFIKGVLGETSSIHLLGASIGCRMLLSVLASDMPVQTVHFISPDGIKNRFLFSFATLNKRTRYLVSKSMKWASLLLLFVRVEEEDKRILKALLKKERSQQMLSTWWLLSGLRYRIAEIIQSMNEKEIKTFFYLAQRDPISSNKSTRHFSSLLKNSEIMVLKTTHTRLMKEVKMLIRL